MLLEALASKGPCIREAPEIATLGWDRVSLASSSEPCFLTPTAEASTWAMEGTQLGVR